MSAKDDEDTSYEGAYVKEPQVGMHQWVISYDFNSLYPHLQAQFNISPDTLLHDSPKQVTVDGLLNREYDLSGMSGKCMAANGHFFDTTKEGFLPNILMRMYAERSAKKKEMLEWKAELERVERELKRRENENK